MGCGLGRHPVVERGLAFLRASARVDGSWPIDTNLATWLTSLSIDALGGGGQLDVYLDAAARTRLTTWLADQQYREVHPYTHAAPGGWAWTDLAGGVPDADDTAAALIALGHLGDRDAQARIAGVGWLLGLQNRDGGIPTFCRGWGKLPFDRSASDLTAHALRAFSASAALLDEATAHDVARGRGAAIRHLVDAQSRDGSWAPLWFGSQLSGSMENPLYGTSRVVKALGAVAAGPAGGQDGGPGNEPGNEPRSLPDGESGEWRAAVAAGIRWLLAAQHRDGAAAGGFGAAPGLAPTVEETGLALDALASAGLSGALPGDGELGGEVRAAVARGAAWLARVTEGGERFDTAPIGLYFAKLWYSEELYPLIFAVAGLERASRLLES